MKCYVYLKSVKILLYKIFGTKIGVKLAEEKEYKLREMSF